MARRRVDDKQQQMLFGDKPVRAAPTPKPPKPPEVSADKVVMHSEPDAEPEPVERCPTCRQTIKKLNPHRMDSDKVRMLLQIALIQERAARSTETTSEWVLVKEGKPLEVLVEGGPSLLMETSRIPRQHTSRLGWYGLVDKKPGKRSGAFKMNEAGYAFIRGELSVPARIWCMDGEVIERSQDHVSISQVKNVVLSAEYWDGYPEWQSYRGEP